MRSVIVLVITLRIALVPAVKADDADNDTLIDYYVDLIDNATREFETFSDPVDASEYAGNFFDDQAEFQDFGEYDFVVIGAGSSGAVIASRLSEITKWKILLLEAGERENDLTNMPGMYFFTRYSKYNWGYYSVPQRDACQGMVDKRCSFPRGRGLGGSSIMNGVIYSRGNRKDFDLWNTYVANGNWAYKDVLPYFKKSEHSYIPNVDPYYHGFNGPLPINFHVPVSPQTNAFLAANEELGFNETDVNGAQQVGVARNQLFTQDGQRYSTGRAYLSNPPSNLVIFTRAYVTKILIRDQKAYGVEFTYNSSKSRVRVSKEVILSAGVFGSPQILMQSGVGPYVELKRNGIRVKKVSPNVGRNLQDHATFYGLIFQTNYTEPVRSQREYIREYLQGRGPYTISANLEGISFYKTKLRMRANVPDIELLMVPSNSTGLTNQRSFHLTNATYDAIWRNTDPTSTFIVYLVLLQPRSRGYVTLSSNDPFAYPLINPRFLSDRRNYDIETFYQGVQHVLRLIDTEAFRRINTTLIKYTFPACSNTAYLSKEYWYCTIRQMTVNVYHPMGTCAMKREQDGGVVDGDLRLYGVAKLRVVDLSVVPFAISGHPHATAVMIAEKAADMLKSKYGVR